MKALRLSGLQRLGIVGSIVWFFIGGFLGNSAAINDASRLTGIQLDNCVGELRQQRGENARYSQTWEPCWKEFTNNYTRNVEGHWRQATLVGLVPIPFAWLIAWGAIAMYRWVRRGLHA